jgi:hypothetical protein
LNRNLNALRMANWACTVCLRSVARTWRVRGESKLERRELGLLRLLLPSFAGFADEMEVILLRLRFRDVVAFAVLPYTASLARETV